MDDSHGEPGGRHGSDASLAKTRQKLPATPRSRERERREALSPSTPLGGSKATRISISDFWSPTREKTSVAFSHPHPGALEEQPYFLLSITFLLLPQGQWDFPPGAADAVTLPARTIPRHEKGTVGVSLGCSALHAHSDASETWFSHETRAGVLPDISRLDSLTTGRIW